jgi:hypothetical protein
MQKVLEQSDSENGLQLAGSGAASAAIPAFQGGNNSAWPGSPFPDINSASRSNIPEHTGVLHTVPQPLNTGALLLLLDV